MGELLGRSEMNGWLLVEGQRAPATSQGDSGGSLTLDRQPPQGCNSH